MPILTHRFDKALGYASEVHRMHLRKGTDIPYLSHLMGVASLVLEYCGDEDQAIAGLLHDAVEGAGGDRNHAIRACLHSRCVAASGQCSAQRI